MLKCRNILNTSCDSIWLHGENVDINVAIDLKTNIKSIWEDEDGNLVLKLLLPCNNEISFDPQTQKHQKDLLEKLTNWIPLASDDPSDEQVMSHFFQKPHQSRGYYQRIIQLG